MRNLHRAVAVAAGTIALVATGGAAYADDVAATSSEFQLIDGRQTIVLAVGESASVTLTYAVTGTGKDPEDGKAGCNLTGAGSNLTLDVLGTADPDAGPAGLEGLPGQVTFESCDDEGAPSTVVLSFTAVSPGTTTYDFPVDGPATVGQGTWDTAAASFVVVVPADGRDAPAIANEWLHESATAEELVACQDANGTNQGGTNWHGQLIVKVAQFFEGQTFTPEEEQVVIDQVREFCGL